MNDLTIINKMIKELQLAKENEHSRQQLLKHISNVQLLSELFLEDTSTEEKLSSTSSISEQEIKAMLGGKHSKQVEEKQYKSPDYGEANGDSIFDF